MKTRTTFSILAEVDATELFAGESINWKYCAEHATFVHRDACKFILHIGMRSENYADTIIAEMREYGCTPDFIEAYTEARDAGALRVLFTPEGATSPFLRAVPLTRSAHRSRHTGRRPASPSTSGRTNPNGSQARGLRRSPSSSRGGG